MDRGEGGFATGARVRLPDGREVSIRAAREEDGPALQTLYAGLDDGDRHRRFFSAFRPPEDFVAAMTTAEERGGCQLVAVPTSPQSCELAGEAGYALLPNGNGELAITVARTWRGGLGRSLLDALLAAARRRGVPNLEADVLTTNAAMLALAQGSGCVYVERPDTSFARIVIGTSPPSATWAPRRCGPRVLVEGPAGPWHEKARAAGLDVIACPGPRQKRPACPAISGLPCPLVAGADAVVVRPRADIAAIAPALLAAHRDLHPGVKVWTEPAGEQQPPPRADDIVALLRDLIAGSP
ncbi:MAG TPA: GNAT family N-acetyltransferase [Acidimicrobiales bacterium]|nr:GNAT family N-acetyltransferase [Acidimicrobiales bacterium]